MDLVIFAFYHIKPILTSRIGRFHLGYTLKSLLDYNSLMISMTRGEQHRSTSIEKVILDLLNISNVVCLGVPCNKQLYVFHRDSTWWNCELYLKSLYFIEKYLKRQSGFFLCCSRSTFGHPFYLLSKLVIFCCGSFITETRTIPVYCLSAQEILKRLESAIRTSSGTRQPMKWLICW